MSANHLELEPRVTPRQAPGTPGPGGDPHPVIRGAARLRKIHMLKDFLPRVFESKDSFLDRNKLAFTDDLASADILIGRRVSDFRPKHLALDRLNVVWTHEPFFELANVPMVKVEGRMIHVFNLYNGNVYTDNFFDFHSGRTIPAVTAADLNVPFGEKRIVAVMTRKTREAVIDGVDRSLTSMRERIAMDGHRAGGIDIYGGGWDDGVAKGESRYEGNRQAVKRQILSGYNFNLCLENCSWDYYVTEKLWEAIIGRCLPIYHANGTIRQLPFIDGAILVNDRPDFAAIRDAIDNITEVEFLDRLNTMIAFHNRSVLQKLRFRSRARTRERFASFLRAMA